jgi:hypothetical protein
MYSSTNVFQRSRGKEVKGEGPRLPSPLRGCPRAAEWVHRVIADRSSSLAAGSWQMVQGARAGEWPTTKEPEGIGHSPDRRAPSDRWRSRFPLARQVREDPKPERRLLVQALFQALAIRRRPVLEQRSSSSRRPVSRALYWPLGDLRAGAVCPMRSTSLLLRLPAGTASRPGSCAGCFLTGPFPGSSRATTGWSSPAR